MLPRSLALIDDDAEYTEFLSQFLRDLGMAVDVFGSPHALLAHDNAFGFDFYIVDLMLPGIDGIDLIDVLRRRTRAGLVVVSGRLAPEVFQQVVRAGADMYLAKPVQFEQVAAAIEAVQRRADTSQRNDTPWKVDRRGRQLIAPDGVCVDLSEIDLLVLGCLVEARGAAVTREALCQRLRRDAGGDAPDGLNAIIYRLRRRIERATPVPVPLQSKPRVGYVFKAGLMAV
ncbi:MAG: response regulator transcription factor [Aquabacterium sp.]|nr:response regulator transcription factor [Aquabacterium sp.]